MSTPTPARRHGGRHDVRAVGADDLVAAVGGLLDGGARLALACAVDDAPGLRAVYLFTTAGAPRHVELHVALDPDRPVVPTIAGISFPGGRFERQMHDLFGIVPLDHPLPRRLVRHPNWPAGWYPMRADAGPPPPFAADADPYGFGAVEGPGVYEIPVGPVHAGLIEPGHFRFSVVGETIVKMKARLWFVHRGLEKLFEGRSPGAAVELAERISGDSAAAHGLAYALAVEDATGWETDDDGERARALVVELERVYNHVTDIGALANDVGHAVLNAHAQRIRERLLRINATVTGHRLLRGAITPGATRLLALPDPGDLAAIAADIDEVAELALRHGTVLDRFTGTGVLDARAAVDLGCLGPVARASGVDTDARRDHPRVNLDLGAPAPGDGDVLARFLVRRDEIRVSIALITGLVADCGGHLTSAAPEPASGPAASSGVGIVEGWRGTVVHRVEMVGGRISRMAVVDPSWFNWPALPVALAETIVPDFPLVNKSFNLSYAGNDL